uniref:Uncharacterized protein n=1 Tax=Rhizophora mucronata TaxID=61149 RepID=A0A2P2KV40_RHIMU
MGTKIIKHYMHNMENSLTSNEILT